MTRPVSLHRRILLVTILAIIALSAAAMTMTQVRADGSAARERDAFERGDAIVQALAKRLTEEQLLNAPDKPISSQSELPALAASLVRPHADASGGICTTNGSLLLVETVAPPAFPPFADVPDPARRVHPPSMLPMDRDFVIKTCQSASSDTITHGRHAAPNDLLFVSVHRVTETFSTFALIRMPNRARDRETRSWHLSIGALGLATVLLVLLTLDTLRILRQGTQSLERALVDLQDDLGVDIPVPRARELAKIARRMKEMATNLASSREREGELARRLGQEQRLISLGRVVAGVAHEVRNPLTGMKLKLDSMAKRQLDTRSSRDVGTCLEEIERLDRVVRSMLLIARRGPIVKTDIDIGALVDERISLQMAIMQTCGVQAVRYGDAHVSANREDLGRVIDNLLRNAVEASPRETTVMVQIATTSTHIRLEVIDMGSGVPETRMGELFEPFFTCKPDGTGLGLVLSRAIIEAHEGQLTYERHEGQTRFIADIPIQSPEALRDG